MTQFDVPAAASPEQTPYLPKGPPDPLLFEVFDGINTQTTRPGVDDKQAYWMDGWMPISPRKLRTIPGVGIPIVFSDAAPVSFFGFANIGSTPYSIVIHTDGSTHAVNTSTYGQSQIAAAGTITNPSRLNVGLSQYGSQLVMIVSKQTNGYFLWDGTTFFQPGGLSPTVTVTAGGTGYTNALVITATGGSGSGATFSYTLSGDAVATITVTNPGTGYVAGDTPTLVFTRNGGSGSAATGTIALMPTGISGTAIEIYAGRVWVANGATITFSAPGSYTDFSSADGGGNFTSSDSFLRSRYIQLLQTNGFLYLLADSSINYISGVQTGGTPLVTTFTNQNADPEVGTPWPSTVNTFGRNILFANAFGAHVSYGAAVNKISDMLDGVYNTVPNFGGLIPSAAKAILFGKRVWLLLLPIIDPITGQQTNKIYMWDSKRWWSTPQDVPLFYIQNQEIDSVLTAWGTDGTNIYPLFQTPTTAFTKVAQTKLWDKPGDYRFNHLPSRLWGILQYYDPTSPDIIVTIDNETATGGNEYTVSSPVTMDWTTNGTTPMNWTTPPAVMTWQASGIGVIGPENISQTGVLTGMTIETNCADMAIISMAMGVEVGDYRG